MIEVLRDSWRRAAFVSVLGGYAALFAMAADYRAKAALAAPLIVIPVVWWTIQGPRRWLGIFFFCALLLPPLPIAVGESGPHVALAVVVIGFLAGLLRFSDWRIPSGLLPRSMLVFAALLLASVSLAALYSGAIVAAGSLARVLLFAISVYVFCYTAYGPGFHAEGDDFRWIRGLFWLAIGSAVFACLDFYFHFPAPAGYEPQFVWLDSGVYRRAQGVFYEASTLGNFCAFFLIMIAAGLLRPKRDRPVSLPVMLIGGSLLSTALILSYSRSSILNIIAAIAALAYLNRERISFRRLGAVALLSVAGGAVAVYSVFPAFAQTYWTRLWLSGANFFEATNGVLSGRLETWSRLVGFLLERPWYALFGIGYKTLPYSDFIGQTAIADNMYLSLLVETGIIGLTAFLIFNAAVLRTALRAARALDPRTAFFGTWIFCFWIGELFQMLSGDLFTYWRVLPVYFWVLALAARGLKA